VTVPGRSGCSRVHTCATWLRNPALRSTRMFGVARRAERLGTTLAKLRMMPADFAVALGALRQMRTHTSSDSALLRRVDCVVLVSGRRHTSLPWRTGPMPGVGEEVAFDASGCCPVADKFKPPSRGRVFFRTSPSRLLRTNHCDVRKSPPMGSLDAVRGSGGRP
jgi:hypothetical protein